MGKSRTLADTVSTGNILAAGGDTVTDPLIVLGGSQGTSGQALLSAGPGIPPAWGGVASGLTLIQTHTFSGALTYNVENFSADYDDYLILVDNVASASNAAFSARLKVGGSYQTTSTYRMHVAKPSSASASYAAWNTSALPYITISGASIVVPNRGTFAIQALGVNNASRYPMIFWQGSFSDTTNLYTVSGSADIPVTGALQGIQFMAAAGDTVNVGGTVRVYGYKKTP